MCPVRRGRDHGLVTALAIVLALAAAALLAVGSVAQQRTAATVPDDEARGLGLIRRLVRQPMWWAGAVGDTGGYVVQAVALVFGSVLLVQPVLVTTLLFALPLGAWWTGRRLRRSDWVWAIVLAVALAVFVVTGDPTDGVATADVSAWLPTGIALLVVLAVSLAVAGRSRGTRRAVLLAVVTAICYGVAAALTKGVVREFGNGLGSVLTSWETYALVAVSILGTVTQQSAFQAGTLAATLPTVTVGEPVVAVIVGIVVLQERVRADGAEWVLIGLLVVAMVLAGVRLAQTTAPPAPEAVAAEPPV